MKGRHDEELRDLIDNLDRKGAIVKDPMDTPHLSPNRIGPQMSNKDLQRAINDAFDMWCECDLNQKPPERIYRHLDYLLIMQASRSRLVLQEPEEQKEGAT